MHTQTCGKGSLSTLLICVHILYIHECDMTHLYWWLIHVHDMNEVSLYNKWVDSQANVSLHTQTRHFKHGWETSHANHELTLGLAMKINESCHVHVYDICIHIYVHICVYIYIYIYICIYICRCNDTFTGETTIKIKNKIYTHRLDITVLMWCNVQAYVILIYVYTCI